MVEISVLSRPLHRTVGDIVFFPNLITCAKILVHYKCLQRLVNQLLFDIQTGK